MSFQNNLTLDIGSLRPCFIQPVMPGDSWSIESVHGLRFMPLTYPIQTRMKSSIHFFYVRNRNLWKDWPDFIGKTKQGLVPPYIHLNETNRKQIETCQLGDFLGLPTKVYGFTRKTGELDGFSQKAPNLSAGTYDSSKYLAFNASKLPSAGLKWSDVALSSSSASGQIAMSKFTTVAQMHGDYTDLIGELEVTWSNLGDLVPTQLGLAVVNKNSGLITYTDVIDAGLSGKFQFNFNTAGWPDEDEEFLLVLWNNIYWSSNKTDMQVSTAILLEMLDGVDVSELTLAELPYRSDDNPTGIPLSSLPFRAYESIYNAFYRNAENNPFMINGVPEYNKWIRTNEGGADTNIYLIHYHNWEDDFLTTAVPSPQQGNAPLVGLSGTPTLTVAHDDGTTTQMQLDVNDEGQVIAVSEISGDGATTQALMEAVSYGIAINDLRNVNSFQRWLENNIRRGYKYKDQIKTHYGVSVRYDELDMPEFIGGISEPVMVNQISQTVATENGALGDMAGQASVFGQSKNITHYCDEHGFIIGIICIKPVANYSQLLPKYFNVTDTFDYYFPEFGHIGMQPITYAEVTPLQAHLEGKLNDVFGYQRAWYDLISKTDEVHGLFRNELRNFLINRTFNGTPELGKAFTVIDPDQINDVFAYTENTDKILGQVFFKCSKKTPIPLYGIPKLE